MPSSGTSRRAFKGHAQTVRMCKYGRAPRRKLPGALPIKKTIKDFCFSPLWFLSLCKNQRDGLCLHAIVFVRNSQFLSALGATCCQYSTTVGCSHSLTETVLVFSLSVRGLECSFHLLILFYVIILTNSGCKNRDFFQINQAITHFLSKVFAFFTDFHYFCTRKTITIPNIIKTTRV